MEYLRFLMHFEFFSKVRIYRQCQRTLKKNVDFLNFQIKFVVKCIPVIESASYIGPSISQVMHFFLKCCHLHMNHESPKNFILLLSIFYACEINNKFYVDWSYVTELYLCIFTGWSILKSQINHITESPKRL